MQLFGIILALLEGLGKHVFPNSSCAPENIACLQLRTDNSAPPDNRPSVKHAVLPMKLPWPRQFPPEKKVIPLLGDETSSQFIKMLL